MPTDPWQVLRWAHIAAGVLGFVVAPVALITRKGGPTHRQWGFVYVVAMTFATLSATALAAVAGNTFFTFVGAFSFYLGFSGYRAIGKRAGGRWFDWLTAVILAAVVLGMFAYGVAGLAAGAPARVPLLVFGLIGGTVVGRDLWHLARPPADPNAWFFGHMIGMVSSATAAMAAFSVTNATFLPLAVRLLWPACVSMPGLVLWVRAYRRKFAAGRTLKEFATVRRRGPG